MVNLGYFCYSQGWLDLLTGEDAAQREPERVSRQVNPDAIEVTPITQLSPTAAAAPPETEPAPPQEPACAATREEWLVYMGPYASQALSDKKKTELTALGITSTPISKPSHKLGLTLGQFESEAQAREALAVFAKKGVKTAAVLLWTTVDCPPN